MARHELKCWPSYFEALWIGQKTFEVRKEGPTRSFSSEDTLIIREHYSHNARDGSRYTGRELRARVGYVLREFEGLAPGYVALGIQVTDWRES